MGACISWYFLYAPKKMHLMLSRPMLGQAFGLLGIGMVFYAVFTFNKQTPYPSLFTLIPTIGAGLIILFASKENIAGRILSLKIFTGIGLISYSAYLWHQPLFAFYFHLNYLTPPLFVRLCLIFLIGVLAYLSWRYVEKPFRKKESIDGKAVLRISLIGSMFFIGFGISGYLTDGFTNRH
ncbi:MAG: acyltransferase, partial [Planctomycetes bacterium]|nr:acyltransferase [Planctomycetota bacterium]